MRQYSRQKDNIYRGREAEEVGCFRNRTAETMYRGQSIQEVGEKRPKQQKESHCAAPPVPSLVDRLNLVLKTLRWKNLKNDILVPLRDKRDQYLTRSK